jgi:Ca-activated chloride channel family protein
MIVEKGGAALLPAPVVMARNEPRLWGNLRLPFAFLLLLSPFSAISQETSPDEEFKISTHVELVLLDASVKDPKGGYVSGLGKGDFRVFENGVLQNITEFSGADVPVAVGLVMDDSGSMGPKRPEVVTAGLAFAGASNPQDQIFVVNFNDKVRRGLPDDVAFTDDISLLRRALVKDRPAGQTALYDAIAYALDHLQSGRREKKALVLVSDGGDNCSKRNLTEVLRLIQESRATLYTVGIFDADDTDSNPRVLARMAKISGGESFLPDKLDEIIPICTKIAKDIRSRYTIGYTPARSGDDGALRKIHVVATSPDRGKLIVRTRSSYLLPARKTSSPATPGPSK